MLPLCCPYLSPLVPGTGEGNVPMSRRSCFSRAGLLADANTHPANLARHVACSKNRSVFEPTVKAIKDIYDSKFKKKTEGAASSSAAVGGAPAPAPAPAEASDAEQD